MILTVASPFIPNQNAKQVFECLHDFPLLLVEGMVQFTPKTCCHDSGFYTICISKQPRSCTSHLYLCYRVLMQLATWILRSWFLTRSAPTALLLRLPPRHGPPSLGRRSPGCCRVAVRLRGSFVGLPCSPGECQGLRKLKPWRSC